MMDGSGGLKPVYTMNNSPTLQENYNQSPVSQAVVQQTQIQPQTQTYQPTSTGIFIIISSFKANNGNTTLFQFYHLLPG